MRTAIVLVLVSALVLGGAGCAGFTAPVIPPTALVVTSIKAPLDPDLNNTTLGTKSGTGKTMSILGLVALGDCSIEAAAKDGDIKTITHADYEYFSVLFGVYSKFVVKVYGD